MYYVYILQGTKHYVGYTNNLFRRISEHKRGNDYFTKRIGNNITLLGWFECDNKKHALSLETKIKKSGHIDRWLTEKTFIINH